jgi:riboflavin kinase/FMN adenylyltransferase
VRRFDDVDQLPHGLRFVLAIGVFDGVHRGHRRVLAALTSAARRLSAESVVLTFEPHPAAVLRGTPPPRLCDLDERLALFAAAGVENVVVQRFDSAFADQQPEAFMSRLCTDRQLVGLVMTSETAFGRDRAAGPEAIRQMADRFGYEVIEVPHVASAGETLSSTRLRGLLGAGRLGEANRLLGRPYSVSGTVIEGDRRGRELGYPTANLAFDAPVALPADGIYAVRVSWTDRGATAAQRSAAGVASLGVRPTFGAGGARILEVHLFDIDEDLYGLRLRVEFVRRLRGEKRFSSARTLIAQMDRDAARARALLG